jgi:hypothetical protein
MAAVQNLAEVVDTLREDQRALRQQMAVIAEKGREKPLPPVASGPPDNPSSAALPPVSLAAAAPVTVPNPLLPHPFATANEPSIPETMPPPPAPPGTAMAEEYALTGKEKRARLVRHLRSHAGQEINIRVAGRDAGAAKLALALRSVFREAGWTVGELETASHPLPAQTLTLSTGAFPPTKEFVAAYGALAAAGFIVSSELAPIEGPRAVSLAVGPVR